MLDPHKQKQINRARRHKRICVRIQGIAAYPRLSVFRSLTSLEAQLVDDENNRTLFGANERSFKLKGVNKTERAKVFGREFARLAQEKGIRKVKFDRGGYAYHGRIKAFAEGAREGGLEF